MMEPSPPTPTTAMLWLSAIRRIASSPRASTPRLNCPSSSAKGYVDEKEMRRGGAEKGERKKEPDIKVEIDQQVTGAHPLPLGDVGAETVAPQPYGEATGL